LDTSHIWTFNQPARERGKKLNREPKQKHKLVTIARKRQTNKNYIFIGLVTVQQQKNLYFF
jgi:hypothetical protein